MSGFDRVQELTAALVALIEVIDDMEDHMDLPLQLQDAVEEARSKL